MNTDERDDLWRLLGKARQPAVSPFFSRNILRAIREERGRAGVLPWLLHSWRLASAGVCALLVAGAIFMQLPPNPDPVVLLAQQVSASPDYHVIHHLDELLDSEQNSVWLDNQVY